MHIILILLLEHFAYGFSEFGSLPPADQHALLCVKRIIRQYFIEEYPITISLPPKSHDPSTARKLDSNVSANHVPLNDFIIKELTHDMNWPAVVMGNEAYGSEENITLIPGERPRQVVIIVNSYHREVIDGFVKIMVLYNYQQ